MLEQMTGWTSKVYDESAKAVKDTMAQIDKATMPPISDFMTKDPRKFLKDKYKSDQHMYPADLMSEVYGGNYAVFYINVSEDSRLNVKSNTVELDPKTESRMRGSLVTQKLDVATLAGANAGTQVMAAIGGGKKDAGLSGAVKDSAGAALGVAAAGTMAPDASRSQRRLKTAIALHIPNQLSVRYGTQWSEEDTAALQGAADAILAGLGNKGSNGKQSTLPQVAREGAAAIALNKVQNPGAVSAALGIAANPKKEQTFKGVDFRKFTFEYQFFPRDEIEARNVMNIIEAFKLHMHPEFKSSLNYVWIYPSEFDIIYYSGGVENTHIHKHTSCVLEEMNVNYTPNGAFAVFANGMPTQINMTLGFKELQILSKETIAGGL
jgi:hypothetical protein